MEQKHSKNPVNITCVNHGNVFGPKNWFTFYCGYCGKQIQTNQKKCKHCGAILRSPIQKGEI